MQNKSRCDGNYPHLEPDKEKASTDYGPLIEQEEKLLKKLGDRPLPYCLQQHDFWKDDFSIFIKELSRYLKERDV